MKKSALFSTVALLASSLFAADPDPKDEVNNAAKKLADAANYSWTQTVVVPESAQFKPGPTQGKTEKDGYVHVTWSFNDTESQGIIKGTNGAGLSTEGGWQSLTELESSEGFGRFTAMTLRNIKTPASQATNLAASAKELKKAGDAVIGELTDEGAKALLRFSPETTVSTAKASVKFWVKDGALTKYEITVKGKVDFNGNEMDLDTVTTVEIKAVGTTKVTVPAEAKAKLG
jgi:hypothetical protein